MLNGAGVKKIPKTFLQSKAHFYYCLCLPFYFLGFSLDRYSAIRATPVFFTLSNEPSPCFQVTVNYENAELAPRERAMLDFAMAVCRCDTITEQHFQSLEKVGFDREDAWDIAAIAAFFAMSNRLAHLTDMRPNLEFFNMGRMPRDKSKDKAGDAK